MFKKILFIALVIAAAFSLQGVTELTDSNFAQLVTNDSSIWVVLFAAQWCGHCTHLKPEIQKLAPRLQKLGVKVGHVDEKGSRNLVNDYVVDHKTHMVSYPKLKVFLGSEVLADVPMGLRNADDIYYWVLKQYNLQENVQSEL